MPQTVLQAFQVVKGEMNGDEYLWEHEEYDAVNDIVIRGAWKSYVDKQGAGDGVARNVREYSVSEDF